MSFILTLTNWTDTHSSSSVIFLVILNRKIELIRSIIMNSIENCEENAISSEFLRIWANWSNLHWEIVDIFEKTSSINLINSWRFGSDDETAHFMKTKACLIYITKKPYDWFTEQESTNTENTNSSMTSSSECSCSQLTLTLIAAPNWWTSIEHRKWCCPWFFLTFS